MAKDITKKIGPEAIYYQLLEIPTTKGEILEYSDCVEISLLSFLRYVVATDLSGYEGESPRPKRKGGLLQWEAQEYPQANMERLAELTSDVQIHEWFAAHPTIYPDSYYRVRESKSKETSQQQALENGEEGEEEEEEESEEALRRKKNPMSKPGVQERISWSQRMALRAGLIYNFDDQSPPQRFSGNPAADPGTYELRATMGGFFRLMQFFFPQAGLDPRSFVAEEFLPAELIQSELDKLSAIFSTPSRPVQLLLGSHEIKPMEDLQYRESKIHIIASGSVHIYTWTIYEWYLYDQRQTGHSDFSFAQ